MAVFRISLFKVGPYSVFQIYGNPCISRIPYSRKTPVEYCPGLSPENYSNLNRNKFRKRPFRPRCDAKGACAPPPPGHCQRYQQVNTGDPHHKFVTKSVARLSHRPLDRSVITGVRPVL